MTSIVNIKSSKCDIYIGRGTICGNPFVIGKDGTRKEVIEKYKKYVAGNRIIMSQLYKLKDKVLGCHCKPLECHGDILVRLIEGEII